MSDRERAIEAALGQALKHHKFTDNMETLRWQFERRLETEGYVLVPVERTAEIAKSVYRAMPSAHTDSQ